MGSFIEILFIFLVFKWVFLFPKSCDRFVLMGRTIQSLNDEKIRQFLSKTCVSVTRYRKEKTETNKKEGNLCHQQFSEKFSSEFEPQNRNRIVRCFE